MRESSSANATAGMVLTFSRFAIINLSHRRVIIRFVVVWWLVGRREEETNKIVTAQQQAACPYHRKA